MFKEIRQKITLFNIIILLIFIFLFMLLFGFMLHKGLSLSGELYIYSIAKDIIQAERREINIDKKHYSIYDHLGYDYIIWDKNDNVYKMRVDSKDLVTKGYETKIYMAEIGSFNYFDMGLNQYRVFSKPFGLNGDKYVVQVFQIINPEQTILEYIAVCLFFFGIGWALILIPISYFIAGKSLQPVKDTYENQKKFIADVSHELRTPLTVIQTNIEVLKMKEDEILLDNIHWLNNISHEADNMTALISELLTMAQADNKKIITKKESFDISAVCAEIVDLMFDVAKEKEITLIGNIPKGIEYKGEEERLKRSIRILVDNAIKYSNNPSEVTLTLSENVLNVMIAVEDHGIGISQEEQKKIFSRFYRVDNARYRENGGFGLGLNIADIIVKQHGGRIEVESELDKGSTFTIYLPKTIL